MVAGAVGCAEPAGRAPEAGEGGEVRRVVALAPNLAEIVADVGAGGRLVGISSFGRVPPGAARAVRVGGFVDPSIERIIALRPDLVVGVPLQGGALASCRAAGLATEEIGCQSIADVAGAYVRLGALLGVEDAARAAAGRIDERLARVRAAGAAGAHPRTLLLLGHAGEDLQQVFPVTPGTFTHELLEIAGGRNVLEGPTVSIGAEAVITLAPEVIVEIAMDDRGGAAEERLPPSPVWARLPSIPAVRDGRIHRVASASLLQPGPSLADGAELLYRLLHGSQPDSARSDG
jgi:iron complex transport system substrate-binding protein